ncbi:holo-ACP synthase [Halalkalibacillus halophilus]|uniref:holo-ACP synthase n=1 Tax=Halalkalibacillus halophilus TaxID=392827 RepID=UPI0004188580|nr:holo-ACP synthase [Halalkalibacillus halophilus]
MITGIGIDLAEIERIDRLYKKKDRFPKRILSSRELEIFDQLMNRKRKLEFLAGRFAAKEAYSKACGTGIGSSMSFVSIEVLPLNSGKPVLFVSGVLQSSVLVSISHSKAYAVAQVVIQTE